MSLPIEHPRFKVFADFVRNLATLSKCTDKHVAAIIFDEDVSQIYSIGVNGGPKGGQDCLCTLGGKYTCAHAEANALAKCSVDCKGKSMMISMNPCIACATLIVNSGISHVYYLDEYHDKNGLKILEDAHIPVLYMGPEKQIVHQTLPEFSKLQQTIWNRLLQNEEVIVGPDATTEFLMAMQEVIDHALIHDYAVFTTFDAMHRARIVRMSRRSKDERSNY